MHQRRSRKKFSIVRNTKLEAGIALGGGAGGLRLKNENGVILSLHSTEGIELGLERRGVTVTME